jgi:hypothetical protein
MLALTLFFASQRALLSRQAMEFSPAPEKIEFDET